MYEALLKATPEYQKIAASFAKPGPAALFGLPRKEISFGEIWAALLDRPELQSPLFKPWFDLYRERGPLARRLVERAGLTPSRPALRGICDDLCACLAEKTFFV